MGVQSYLALYTTLLGWKSYDALFTILAQLGFMMLPFFFIAARSFLDPFMSMGAKSAGVVGARRFILHTIFALFVFVFAAIPTVNLNPSVLHFTPKCQTGQQHTATPGNTGTTYDSSIPIPQGTKVPIFWYLVMAISNGITNAAENTVSCPVVNLRDVQQQLNLTVIKSAALKQEVQAFQQQCYVPAYSKYSNDNKTGTDQTAIKQAVSKYGTDSVGWIGSNVFLVLPGFYGTLRATSPITGFLYSGTGVNSQVNAQTGTPKWGTPTCLAWWSTDGTGLLSKVYKQFKPNVLDQVGQLAVRQGVPREYAVNAAVRIILERSTSFYSEQDNSVGAGQWLANKMAPILIDKHAFFKIPEIQILKNSLPIIQAMLLAAIYMLLAFLLPLSRYSLGFLVTASMFIFIVTFCSYLWHWVSWMDNSLMQALYGLGDKAGTISSIGEDIAHFFVGNLNPQQKLLTMVISGFYEGLPLLAIITLSWAGVKVGSAINMAVATGIAANAGRSVGGVAKGTANVVRKGL